MTEKPVPQCNLTGDDSTREGELRANREERHLPSGRVHDASLVTTVIASVRPQTDAAASGSHLSGGRTRGGTNLVLTPKDIERAFKLGWGMSYNGKGGHRGAVRAADLRFMWEQLRP